MKKPVKKPFKIYSGETFKEIDLGDKLRLRYAISDFGRLISFTDTFKDGNLLNGSILEGYRIFRYKVNNGKKISHKHKFYYKLVAQYFIPKDSDDQTFVLHLDHKLDNDVVSNLKWATKQEMQQHRLTNPKVQRMQKETTKQLVEFNRNREGTKLTTTQVMLIKKILANPNRKTRMKIIAKRFGISEMQLYRIKSGENWARIKI